MVIKTYLIQDHTCIEYIIKKGSKITAKLGSGGNVIQVLVEPSDSIYAFECLILKMAERIKMKRETLQPSEE